MHLHRIQAKLFVENEDVLDPLELIPVFHKWIQEGALDELLIDVANYAHVPNGPGVLLIAHEADYSIDFQRGRVGILYTRKRDVPTDSSDAVRLALDRVVQAADRLEKDTNLRFTRDEIEVAFPDRLRVPNEDASLDLVRDALTAALQATFPGSSPTLTRLDTDARLPFAVHVSLEPAPAHS